MMKCHAVTLPSILTILLSILVLIKAELFTALVELEPLLHTKGEIIKTLDKYLEVENERLKDVRRLWKEYSKLHTAARADEHGFLTNPVNAFLLMKSLTTEWRNTVNLIDTTHSKAIIRNITQKKLMFPSVEDLNGAALALIRLQDTYLLDATKLANGEIDGAAKVSELSAEDCFELGRQAYITEDHYHSVQWFLEALNRVDKEKIKTLDKLELLDHLAFNVFQLRKFRLAVKLTQDMLNLDPNHPRAMENMAFYKMYVDGTDTEIFIEAAFEEMRLKTEIQITQRGFGNRVGYEYLCRGERDMTLKEESRLYCRYTSNKSSYLLLQPAKEEVISLEPRIVMYHNVISDKDIEIIKQLSRKKLERATVLHTSKDNLLEHATYRVSKSAWLKDRDHPVFVRAARMVEEVTNLETDTAEDLQVVNYGIGGHYEPHFDYRHEWDADGFAFLGTGNRIATWIYYLSDVEAGGGTAFPDIGIHVKPRKGSAAFWFNLYKSGAGDLRTRHGGCPVLAGTKWIANKWLHEKDQQFRRRCSLNPSE